MAMDHFWVLLIQIQAAMLVCCKKIEVMVWIGSLDCCCKVESRFVKKKEYTVLTIRIKQEPLLRVWSPNSKQRKSMQEREVYKKNQSNVSCDD
jgi:hypothetical protein